MRRIVRAVSLFAASILLAGAMIVFGCAVTVGQQHAVPRVAMDSYLELSTVPSLVTPGSTLTLRISYHNLGLPYTYVNISPTGLITFDPPLSMPCMHDHDDCTAITFRALATGVVGIHAGATGEVWGETCHCWYWGVASDNGPARIVIADTVWRALLPSAQR
jgi:hypothetical protein